MQSKQSADGAGLVLNAIRRVMLQKLSELRSEMQDFNGTLEGRSKDDPRLKAKVVELGEKWLAAMKDVSELIKWSYPYDKAVSVSDALRLAAELRDVCSSEEIATNIIKKIGKKPARRPATNRPIAILALEAKIREPEKGWTWGRLANEFCCCGKTTHDFRCRENVRKGVKRLQSVLEKYAIDLGVEKS